MELNQFRDVDIVLDKANDNIIQKQFVSAGDKDGRSLTVQLTDNGVIGEIIGATLNLYWHNQASGLTDLSAFYVVDRATSVFKIDYPQNMLTPGKVIAYIQILHGGKVTHTKPFEITVQNLAGTTRGVLATAEYGALVTTLAKANEFETEIAKKADKTEVVAVSNEIADIIATAGDGTIPTELLNIRTGQDGKVYTTAKQRNDAETLGLKNTIANLVENNPSVLIDCTNPNIEYSGDWTLGSGYDYNGTNQSSSNAGDYVEYAFVGNGVRIYDRTASSRGIVEVFLDGVSQGSFDRYSASAVYSALVFQKINLDYGHHRVRIVVTGTKNDLSTGNAFTFDYLNIINSVTNKLKNTIVEDVDVEKLKQFSPRGTKTVNLFDFKKAVLGYSILNGELVANNTRSTSDFIEIKPNVKYVKSQTTTAHEASLFDENKVFIQEIISVNGVFTIPNNANIKYIRFFINTAVSSLDRVMFVEGVTIPSNYIGAGKEKFTLEGLVLESHEKEYVPYPHYATRLNPPKPLFIPTYDGANQAMHPKVLYFKDGWNGYKYWMSFTPYAYTNDHLENPSIVVSNNGIDWDVPVGLNNPLNIPNNLTTHYNSDPHLVYNSDTNTLECWWRYHARNYTHESIWRRTTTNGIEWTDEEMLMEKNGDNIVTQLQCPVVNFEDGKYQIWVSTDDGDGRVMRWLEYYESTNGTNWQLVREIKLQKNGVDAYVLNHLDIIKKDGIYKLVGTIAGETGITYMTSSDNITYTEPVSVLFKGADNAWDDLTLYRASMTLVDGFEHLYYSAKSKRNTWNTGLIIVDDIANMREFGGLL